MTSEIKFKINRWVAWTPECHRIDEWKRWAKGGVALSENDESPKVKMIAPMVRRRLSRVSKMALEVTLEALREEQVDFTIFCSRHGELHRTVKILSDINDGEIPSPTAFSQSVHNTAAGIYSIISKDKGSNTSTSSGEDSLETAFVTAWARIMSNQAKRVLVVYADEPLPTLFEPFKIKPEVSLSASFVISRESSENDGTNVKLLLNSACEDNSNMDHSCLILIRHLLNGTPEFCTTRDKRSWQWVLGNVDS